MNRERFKNVLLTLLILLSVFFSWTLWTFQPNLSFIDRSQYLQETSIQEKLDPEIIVQPTRMLLHTDNQHYGTTDANLIASAVHDVKKWEIFKVEDITARINDFNHFLNAPGRVELVFNNTLPVSYYENFLNIGDKKPNKNVEFDRIVIGIDGSYQGLYFVSTKNNKVLEAKVDKEALTTFEKEYKENTEMYTSYKAVKLKKGTNLYLPAEKTTIKKYKYYVKLLSAEGFKNALFDDPSFIKREVIEQGTEYQDGSRLLKIMNQTMMLTYTNLSQNNSVYTSDDALQKSIEFINSHAGWDRRYRYASEIGDHEVKFQLYIEGLPVFNDSGMSEIVVDWGADGVVRKYKRPFFAVDWQLPDTEAGELQLRAGQDAYDYLSDQKPGIVDKVEDMRIGYGLKLDIEQKDIIVIEPAWYYLADGYWKRVQFGEQGGNIDGLE